MDFMSRLEMVLSLILLVSIGINILLFVYSRNVAQRLVIISEEIDDLMRDVRREVLDNSENIWTNLILYTYQRMKKQMPRRSRSKKSNHYFTKDHENAIIEYCSTDCNKKKTEIYVTMLQPAFSEMVDKIVYL